MDIDTGLSIAQLVIGLLALFGIGHTVKFFVKKSHLKQIQKTGNNSISIQSGRDTKVEK